MLIAGFGEKKLHHFRQDTCVGSYPFSFGERPRSCNDGSRGTPWGLHEIVDKIGDAAPAGLIFKGRAATDECWHQRPDAGPQQENFVTTRILRLRGLEKGINAGPGIDSFDRYIYIHGTNHPEAFPRNISSGCLLMLDEALINLFNQIPLNSHIYLPR